MNTRLPAARTGHVWDGNGICQVHGRYCSLAPTALPDPGGVDVDLPIPYLLTDAGLAALDGPPATTLPPATPAPDSPVGLTAAAFPSRSNS